VWAFTGKKKNGQEVLAHLEVELGTCQKVRETKTQTNKTTILNLIPNTSGGTLTGNQWGVLEKINFLDFVQEILRIVLL